MGRRALSFRATARGAGFSCGCVSRRLTFICTSNDTNTKKNSRHSLWSEILHQVQKSRIIGVAFPRATCRSNDPKHLPSENNSMALPRPDRVGRPPPSPQQANYFQCHLDMVTFKQKPQELSPRRSIVCHFTPREKRLVSQKDNDVRCTSPSDHPKYPSRTQTAVAALVFLPTRLCAK